MVINFTESELENLSDQLKCLQGRHLAEILLMIIQEKRG